MKYLISNEKMLRNNYFVMLRLSLEPRISTNKWETAYFIVQKVAATNHCSNRLPTTTTKILLSTPISTLSNKYIFGALSYEIKMYYEAENEAC